MSLIVQKFGGSSVRDYAHLLRMARIVKSRVDEGDDVVVVLSAQGDTTDGLLQKAKEISERPSPRELDMLLSAGEQMSAALGAMTLRSIGVEAVSLCAWQIPIETDGTHGNAEIELIDTARIRKELAEGYVVVAAGFQGVDERGDITTLGRGGSDTSAVALAAALKAAELVIYTDVDGIFSSDPRICQNAVRREVISYDDMLLLAQKGAQVLHDRSVALAQAGGVPITVVMWKTPAVSPRGGMLRPNGRAMKNCLRVAVPVALARLTTSAGHVVFAGLVATLGTVSLAAHSIALTAEQAFYIPVLGINTAAATLTGNALGEKNARKLDMVGRSTIVVTLIMMSITGGLLFLSAEGFGDYTSDFAWGQDGVLYAMSGSDTMQLMAYDPAMAEMGQEPLRAVEEREGGYGNVGEAGGIVYFNDEYGNVYAVDTATGTRELFEIADGFLLSPDGSRMLQIVYEDGENGSLATMYLCDLASGTRMQIAAQAALSDYAWSEDSRVLFYLVSNRDAEDAEDYPVRLMRYSTVDGRTTDLGALASNSIFPGRTQDSILLMYYQDRDGLFYPITYQLSLTDLTDHAQDELVPTLE
mgnify:CR=1 FL=1